MRKKLIVFLLFVLQGIGYQKANVNLFQNYNKFLLDYSYINDIYCSINNSNKPASNVFFYSMIGYLDMLNHGELKNKRYITIIDYSLSSNKKRLWVIDLFLKEIVHNTYVAHGINTGLEYAKIFSNIPKSNMSSIGFFITDDTYYGKHGLSLKLDGIEKGVNHNARKRTIVIHPAHYVSEKFINRYGRLGRSFGCPALPVESSANIINLIKDKSLLFIYYPNSSYLTSSKILQNNRGILQLLN